MLLVLYPCSENHIVTTCTGKEVLFYQTFYSFLAPPTTLVHTDSYNGAGVCVFVANRALCTYGCPLTGKSRAKINLTLRIYVL